MKARDAMMDVVRKRVMYATAKQEGKGRVPRGFTKELNKMIPTTESTVVDGKTVRQWFKEERKHKKGKVLKRSDRNRIRKWFRDSGLGIAGISAVGLTTLLGITALAWKLWTMKGEGEEGEKEGEEKGEKEGGDEKQVQEEKKDSKTAAPKEKELGEADALRAKLAERADEVEGLEAKLAAKEGEVQGMNAKLAEKEGEVQRLKRQVADLEGKHSSEQKALLDFMRSANPSLLQVKEKFGTLSKDTAEAADRVAREIDAARKYRTEIKAITIALQENNLTKLPPAHSNDETKTLAKAVEVRIREKKKRDEDFLHLLRFIRTKDATTLQLKQKFGSLHKDVQTAADNIHREFNRLRQETKEVRREKEQLEKARSEILRAIQSENTDIFTSLESLGAGPMDRELADAINRWKDGLKREVERLQSESRKLKENITTQTGMLTRLLAYIPKVADAFKTPATALAVLSNISPPPEAQLMHNKLTEMLEGANVAFQQLEVRKKNLALVVQNESRQVASLRQQVGSLQQALQFQVFFGWLTTNVISKIALNPENASNWAPYSAQIKREMKKRNMTKDQVRAIDAFTLHLGKFVSLMVNDREKISQQLTDLAMNAEKKLDQLQRENVHLLRVKEEAERNNQQLEEKGILLLESKQAVEKRLQQKSQRVEQLTSEAQSQLVALKTQLGECKRNLAQQQQKSEDALGKLRQDLEECQRENSEKLGAINSLQGRQEELKRNITAREEVDRKREELFQSLEKKQAEMKRDLEKCKVAAWIKSGGEKPGPLWKRPAPSEDERKRIGRLIDEGFANRLQEQKKT